MLTLLPFATVDLSCDVENTLKVLPFYDVDLCCDDVEDTMEVLPFYDVVASSEVRRESPKNAGVYVVGQVEDKDIVFSRYWSR